MDRVNRPLLIQLEFGTRLTTQFNMLYKRADLEPLLKFGCVVSFNDKRSLSELRQNEL